LVEHATENRGVVSSILSLGTLGDNRDCGRSTVVVRLLAKEKVVGSNPIARSPDCWLKIEDCCKQSTIFNQQNFYGVVAKWQGKGLQNPYSGVRIPSTPLKSRENLLFFYFI
jgi:hypothetical protein